MTTFVFVFWLTFFILSTDVVLCLNSGGSLFLNALRLESLPLHGFEPVFRLKSVQLCFAQFQLSSCLNLLTFLFFWNIALMLLWGFGYSVSIFSLF